MKLKRIAATATIAAALSAMSLSASVKDLPVRTVNGRVYHYYEVPAKETVYSLCYKLGITKEELVKHNPAVADGLKKGMVLFFPLESGAGAESAPTSATPSTAAGSIFTHHVEKGETIFGIARKYGITTDEVIAQNPILSEGLKAGQTLTIRTGSHTAAPVTTTHQPQAAVSDHSASVQGYIVKKKETLYSIAHEHDLSVAELEAANPGITVLKEGQVLNIPVKGVEQTDAASSRPSPSTIPADAGEPAEAAGTHRTDTIPALQVRERKSISVAVLLPFMLNEETPSKSAQRCTEFYKGFLLAADSLRASGTVMKITAVDTEGSALRVKEFIASPAAKGLDAIIAPDNAEQLAVLGQWARLNDVKVFNTFVVRNDDYLTNPFLMQSNLPSPLMHRKAIDGIVERLRYSTPVFVSMNNSHGDKSDFIADLKKALDANGTTYMDVSFDGKITPANLKALPADGNYTFIPVSGRQADLNKIMPGIIEWRDEAVTPTVRLFGYPEWITFRGETLENMHKLNTTVYSRFYADEESARYRDIENRFHRWYGKGMEPAVPRQGALGFDTGMFLFNYLTDDNDTRYDGVQNGYRFTRAAGDNGGLFNDVLYFINFRPGGVIEKYNL